MTIESIEGLTSGAFSSNLGTGTLFVGNSEVSITLEEIDDGIYVDSLVINMQPCDVRLVVYVTAQRYTPIEPTFTTKTLNFGTYVVGDPEKNRSFEITNNDSEELRITSLDGINLPYILVSPNLSEFPIRLAADSSITVTYSFQTSQEGTFLDTVNVNFDSPCDFDTKINLQGNSSIIIPPGTIIATLPNDLKGEPGTNVLVPISWVGADDFELNTADIERVEAYISYDPSVLYPFNAYPSTEVSAITTKGLPVAGMLKIVCPSDSEYHVESKSIKLYLNSFNMTRLGDNTVECILEIEERVKADLDKLLETNTTVSFYTGDDDGKALSFEGYEDLADIVDLDQIDFTAFQSDASQLLIEDTSENPKEVKLRSNLLRSNCRVTNQPDWGDVFIRMNGKNLPAADSVAKYIVSHRTVSHFHEEICEMVFKHLMDAYKPDDLMVSCLYLGLVALLGFGMALIRLWTQ